jgi:hypothetical protein
VGYKAAVHVTPKVRAVGYDPHVEPAAGFKRRLVEDPHTAIFEPPLAYPFPRKLQKIIVLAVLDVINEPDAACQAIKAQARTHLRTGQCAGSN